MVKGCEKIFCTSSSRLSPSRVVVMSAAMLSLERKRRKENTRPLALSVLIEKKIILGVRCLTSQSGESVWGRGGGLQQ